MTPNTPDAPVEGVGSALVALAERCEATTGPDRELDAYIQRAVTPDRKILTDPGSLGSRDGGPRAPEYGVLADFPMDGWTDWEGVANEFGAPRYTASLDAAMTLVPDACGERNIQVGEPGEPHGAWLTLPTERCDKCGNHQIPTVRGDATTPALALCAAALRARALIQQESRP